MARILREMDVDRLWAGATDQERRIIVEQVRMEGFGWIIDTPKIRLALNRHDLTQQIRGKPACFGVGGGI
jgi:hypothetical protein